MNIHNTNSNNMSGHAYSGSTYIIKNIRQLEEIKKKFLQKQSVYKHNVLVCGGAGCVSSNCKDIEKALRDELYRFELGETINVYQTGCMGMCALGPMILVLPERTLYVSLTPDKVHDIVKWHFGHGEVISEYTYYNTSTKEHIPCIDNIDFYKSQVKVVLENCGIIDYSDIDSYISNDGYLAAARAILNKNPEYIIQELEKSRLRGRGGAGFPTGTKLRAAYNQNSNIKYMICNADEGDPGAFMDRSIIEGDPHSVIEGMLLAAYAIGASQGYVYIRAEYPIAIERLDRAIKQARSCGLLGNNLFDTSYNFDIEYRIGAGAFVCGEETALIASTEGQRGEPRQKPPFPFQKGFLGKPTIINNVETLANIPKIIRNGGDWYTNFGLPKATGTKVFALAGDVVNTGIVEVPLGTPLSQIINNIGGGVLNNRKFKAAQIGGPSGGCIKQEDINVPVDYETLSKMGAIVGSGGLIVMDEHTCMVDTARFFMDFIRDESCGQCAACRIGTKRMLEILERITEGDGKPGDIGLLEDIGRTVQQTSMCGLGQTAPNPVLSAIKNFREEFEEHIYGKTCPAKQCKALVPPEILLDKCRGCVACIKVCPVNAITGKLKEKHVIDKNICIKCGACLRACPFNAIVGVTK